MTKRRAWRKFADRQWAAIVLVSAGMIGCQSTQGPPASSAQPRALPEFTGSLDEALDADPCSTRMHDIAGMLANFCYNHHGRLPVSLDELREAAGPGANMNFTCPLTGQLYVYLQTGLFLPNQTMKVVLWEPTASHGGSRLCVLIPPTDPGTSVTAYVKPIPEKDFQKALAPIQ